MSGACSTHGEKEAYTVFWWGNLRERDAGVVGRIILRWILRKCEVEHGLD